MFVPPPRSQMVGRGMPGPPRERNRASRGRRMTLSAPAIRVRKRRNGAIPLVMVTAYDEPGARLASALPIYLILVGDSMANVVLGQETTLHISIDEMCHHVRAVAAAKPDAHEDQVDRKS